MLEWTCSPREELIQAGAKITSFFKKNLSYVVVALIVLTMIVLHFFPVPALFAREQTEFLQYLQKTKMVPESAISQLKNFFNQFSPDANGLFYIMYLVLGFVIVIFLYSVESGSGNISSSLTSTGRTRTPPADLKSFLFPNGFLKNKNVRLDFFLFGTMPLWRSLLFTAPIFATVSVGHYVHHLLAAHFSSPQWQANFIIVFIYSLVVILIFDLAFYIEHSFVHFTKLGWLFHEPHHSQKELNIFTNDRENPLVLVLSNFFPSGVVGAFIGIFLFFFPSVNQIIIANIAIGFILYLPTNIFRHSHILIRYPLWIEYFFQSPAYHIVHHSRLPHHKNKNLGNFTTVWDRLFGTLYVPKLNEDYEFGTGDDLIDTKHETLHGIYVWQTGRILKQIKASFFDVLSWLKLTVLSVF